MTFNPLKWGRPAQIVAGLALLVIAYSAVTGGVAAVWAKHLTNKTLRGIASAISEIDAAEEKNAAHEATIQAMAQRAAELQKEIDDLNAEQELLRTEIAKAHTQVDSANKARAAAIAAAANRPKIETLEQARDSLNRVLGYKP